MESPESNDAPITSTAIAARQEAVLARPVPGTAESALPAILRAATDPNTDVEKVERLMAMYREMKQEQAEADFNAAMSETQALIGRVAADAKNSQTNSMYATYAQLDREVRPIYTEHGFALSFGTAPSPSPEVLVVTCHVTHSGGHTRVYSIPMPADGKGARGNDVMTKTHATGSAAQYGMRYLLKMIFNIAIGSDPMDDDGNAAGGNDAVEDRVSADWITAINECSTRAELGERRREMIAKLGMGDVNKVPVAVRNAAVKRNAELTA